MKMFQMRCTRHLGTASAVRDVIKQAPKPRLKQYNNMTYRSLFQPPALTSVLLLTLTGLLTSCSTAPKTGAGNAGFKFWVLRYKPPVDASSWTPDEAFSADPEGAALNIAAAMKLGNVEQWLSNWEKAERPQLTPAQQQALQQQWGSLRGAHIKVLGRVVAEANVIVELSAGDTPGTERIQIPLKRENDRWWLTKMDSSSEYLRWESSSNKLVDYLDPAAFQLHMKIITGQKSKASAGQSLPKNSPALTGL